MYTKEKGDGRGTGSWRNTLELQAAKCPVEDCKNSVDITLESIDGITFGAHQKNLEFFSEGFPAAGSTVATEVVQLQENADVLRIMLKFMHNARIPELKNIQFSTIAPLAEAVEKYMIFSAMEVCRAYMEKEVGNHPIEVFMYSAKHGYSSLADKAARMTLDLSTTTFFQRAVEFDLNKDLIFKWYRYRERWMDVLFRLVLPEPTGLQQHKGGLQTCELWSRFHLEVIQRIGDDLTDLSRVSDIVEQCKSLLDDCKYCLSNRNRWASRIQSGVIALPSFSDA